LPHAARRAATLPVLSPVRRWTSTSITRSASTPTMSRRTRALRSSTSSLTLWPLMTPRRARSFRWLASPLRPTTTPPSLPSRSRRPSSTTVTTLPPSPSSSVGSVWSTPSRPSLPSTALPRSPITFPWSRAMTTCLPVTLPSSAVLLAPTMRPSSSSCLPLTPTSPSSPLTRLWPRFPSAPSPMSRASTLHRSVTARSWWTASGRMVRRSTSRSSTITMATRPRSMASTSRSSRTWRPLTRSSRPVTSMSATFPLLRSTLPRRIAACPRTATPWVTASACCSAPSLPPTTWPATTRPSPSTTPTCAGVSPWPSTVRPSARPSSRVPVPLPTALFLRASMATRRAHGSSAPTTSTRLTSTSTRLLPLVLTAIVALTWLCPTTRTVVTRRSWSPSSATSPRLALPLSPIPPSGLPCSSSIRTLTISSVVWVGLLTTRSWTTSCIRCSTPTPSVATTALVTTTPSSTPRSTRPVPRLTTKSASLRCRRPMQWSLPTARSSRWCSTRTPSPAPIASSTSMSIRRSTPIWVPLSSP
jgi:ABC-type oligopeptide transport system, periplasmic component